MSMRILSAALLCISVGLPIGCVSSRTNDRLMHAETTPICAITESPMEFVGTRVVVYARYMTDGSTYTYLQDSRCSGDGIIDVSNLTSHGDESVKSFRRSRKDACVASGSVLLCTLEAEILAEVTVVTGRDGLVAVDLEKIIDYRLLR